MARPTKIGIEYFSLDVDIFEDEKVIPVSSEFGAKGECIIIRVLCAIYRNGYFAECSEKFKFKIAKQANLPESLVSEVIAGLVKWDFFDKIVFDSFGVLTSRRIQKNWKEATRKRIPKNNLDYWLLGVNVRNAEFPAEETPLNQSESTQSKLKESKVNEKDELKFNYAVDEIKQFMESEENRYWLETYCMQNNIKPEQLKISISDFVTELKLQNIREKNKRDLFTHFHNWFKKYKINGTQQSDTKENRVFQA